MAPARAQNGLGAGPPRTRKSPGKAGPEPDTRVGAAGLGFPHSDMCLRRAGSMLWHREDWKAPTKEKVGFSASYPPLCFVFYFPFHFLSFYC